MILMTMMISSQILSIDVNSLQTDFNPLAPLTMMEMGAEILTKTMMMMMMVYWTTRTHVLLA